MATSIQKKPLMVELMHTYHIDYINIPYKHCYSYYLDDYYVFELKCKREQQQ